MDRNAAHHHGMDHNGLEPMMMNKTVLVLDANGRLGRAAVLAFAAAGWQVRAQLRRAPRAPPPARAHR